MSHESLQGRPGVVRHDGHHTGGTPLSKWRGAPLPANIDFLVKVQPSWGLLAKGRRLQDGGVVRVTVAKGMVVDERRWGGIELG